MSLSGRLHQTPRSSTSFPRPWSPAWQQHLAGAALVASSIAILPGALNRFVLAKYALASLASVWALLAGARSGRIPRQVTLAAFAVLAAFTVTALVSTEPATSLVGKGPRYEGLLALATFALVGMTAARLFGPSEPLRAVFTARVLSTCAFAVGLLAVLEAAGLRPLTTSVARPGSFLGNATDQGAWALIAFALLVSFAQRTGDRWAWVGSGMALLAVALSGSRGAWLGLIVTVLVLVLVTTTLRRWLLAAVGGAVVVVIALPALRDRLTATDPLAGSTITGRAQLWEATVSLLRSDPLAGSGPSGFEDAIPRYLDDTWFRAVGSANPPDSPHNLLLQIASAGGLLLLAAVVALIVTVGVAAVRGRDRGPTRTAFLPHGVLAAVSGYVVLLMTHPTSPGPMLLVTVAGAAVIAEPWTRDDRHRSVTVGVRGAAVLLAAVLTAAAVAEIPARTGIDHVVAGNAEAADRSFATAAALRPWDAEIPASAAYAFAIAGEQSGRPDLAVLSSSWDRRIGDRLTDSVPRLVARASAAEQLGELTTAVRILDRAHQQSPSDPAILLRRGVVKAERGDLVGARRDFLAAQRIAPDDPGVAQNLERLARLEGS